MARVSLWGQPRPIWDGVIMLDCEKALLEEFKRVDAICRDMFSCERGVSSYLAQMEQTPLSRRSSGPRWESDYRMLKHIRWLRNRIVHDTSATECSVSDVEWLRDFHSRILKQQDPLAAAQRLERQRPPAAPRTAGMPPRETTRPAPSGIPPKSRRPVTLTAVAVAIIVLLLTVAATVLACSRLLS